MIDTKEAYVEKLQAKLKEWQADIDKLKAKAAQSKADMKIQINEQIGNLESNSQEIQKRLHELGQASGSAWKDIKSGVEQAWGKLDEAVKAAISKFS
jgi:hypothetical protein